MRYGYGYGIRRKPGSASIPVNLVAPAITGDPVVDEELACSDGTWSVTPAGFTYQWKRNGVNISGATNNTYQLTQADAGNAANITCVVTPTNPGSTGAVSNTIVQILDATWYAKKTTLTINDATINSAMNTYIIARKAVSATPSVACYDFVTDKGINIARLNDFSRNLYNPADTDEAKRIEWSGTVTASQANGVSGNGTNGFGVTNINPSTDFPTTDCFILLYIRTNQARNEYDYGGCDGSLRGVELISKFGNGITGVGMFTNETTTTIASLNSAGLWSIRRSGNVITIRLRGTQIFTTTLAESFKPDTLINFMCWGRVGNANAFFSTKQYSHFEIMPFAPSDAEVIALENAVVAKETALSRNV